MKIIATLPPPHQADRLKAVAEHPLVEEARFNVGMRTPYGPKETLERLLAAMGGKPLWIDLKGRQLRIMQWAVPTYGDIILSHKVKVDLPARIEFRGGQYSDIVEVRGNRIFVEPDPPSALGRGQSVNIHGENLEIDGYLTREDKAYIKAAKELGIHRYMLSFVEGSQDIEDVFALDSKAEMIAKIESLKGLAYIGTLEFNEYVALNIVRPMAARDDLYANIGQDKFRIFSALQSIINSTSEAIVASRLCESLRKSTEPSLSDLADLMLLRQIGYREFMLSDELCKDTDAFLRAMETLAVLGERTRDTVSRITLD
ncbi:hypothetical protein HGA34_00135 [Candidatus Falkowbacteria bacterium]|nr:hypothetical protein [Candidatus Falkowbacteria bacterium]